MSKSSLHAHQKDSLQTGKTQTKIWKDALGYIIQKQLLLSHFSHVRLCVTLWAVAHRASVHGICKAAYKMTKQWSDCLFFTVIDYNIRIFLSDRELICGYLNNVGNSLSFPYDFQKHKQEMTQVKLSLAK